MSRLFALRLLPFALGLILAAGCSHYELGTGAKLGFSTVYIEPVAIQAQIPQAREIISTQLREAFSRDGRVTLVNSAEEADVTLRVVLTDYRRDQASAREDDTGLARKFNLILYASCTLHDNRGGAGGKDLLSNRPVSVQREAFTDSGQTMSEYETLPILAESLADEVANTVLDTW